MNVDDRKKITTNELYLNECMSILYTKIRATGLDVLTDDGSASPNYIFNVENYQHGTVTYGCHPSSVKVHFDGTNFAPSFTIDKKSNGFIYRLKPLNMEYICQDKVLDKTVHEKRVMRTVGESVDYYRYLSCGTFFILIEHYSVDKNGKKKVIDTNAAKYDEEELVDYFYEQMSSAEENLYADDEIQAEESEIEEEGTDSLGQRYDFMREEFNQSEIEEIDAYSKDESYDDMCEIDYSLLDFFKESLNDDAYQSDYPDRIEDFDYQEYLRNIQNKKVTDGSEELVYKSGDDEEAESTKHDECLNDYNQEEHDDDEYFDEAELDEYENDDEYDEYGVDDSHDLYSLADSIIDEEGFIDDSFYTVEVDGEEINDEGKQEIVDLSVTGIMDVDQEVSELKDYYADIVTELRKMRAIILKRGELVKKRENKKNSSDVSDSGDEEDLNLE